jgi:hypothetical protein
MKKIHKNLFLLSKNELKDFVASLDKEKYNVEIDTTENDNLIVFLNEKDYFDVDLSVPSRYFRSSDSIYTVDEDESMTKYYPENNSFFNV